MDVVLTDRTGRKHWVNVDLSTFFSASLAKMGGLLAHTPSMNTELTVSLMSLIADYERWQMDTGRPAKDAGNARRELERVCEILDWCDLADVAGGRTAYEAHLLALKCSEKTKHNKRAMMSSWLGWLENREMIGESWASRVRLPRVLEVEEPRALSLAEFDRLIAVTKADESKPPKAGMVGNRADQSVYRRHDADRSDMYLVARWTGLRLGEMQAMRRGWIQIRTPEPHIAIPARAAKSRQIRRVPLVGPALNILKGHAQGDPDARVWASWPHPKVIDSDFRAAGIRDAGQWHSLRKTFITDALAKGIDPLKIALVVGHKDLRTTLRHYTDPRLMGLGAALTDGMVSVGSGGGKKICGKMFDLADGIAEDTPAEVVSTHEHTPKQLDDNARTNTAHGGLQQFTSDRDCPGVAVEFSDPTPQRENLKRKGSPPVSGKGTRIGVAGFEPVSPNPEALAEIVETAASLLLQVSRLLSRTYGGPHDDEDRRSER